MGMGTGMGPTCQQFMGMGMGTGTGLRPWVRIRVWLHNFCSRVWIRVRVVHVWFHHRKLSLLLTPFHFIYTGNLKII